ncbi:hypothetical protein NS234_02295 [Microbacterium oxydans]|nr:hypothetical protein NS234_02295 [Microbacterium oxydans]
MLPVNATVAILAGLWVRNDFMRPLILLSDPNSFTLPLVQNVLQGQYTSQYNLLFASYIMAMIPLLIIFVLFQRWIIGGVVRGAIR